MKTADPRTVAGRAFVRSLNVLLKFARLYGFDHSRTLEQLELAWRELRAAVPVGNASGLLIAAAGTQLLIDGTPLEGSPAEKQFAQLLGAAGVGSIQFFSSITQEDLTRLVRAFPAGKTKPTEVAEQLKSALGGAQGIRINEICFVATDARMKEGSMAAQLAASSLASENSQFQQWLKDPQKLLEMISAAEGPGGGRTSDTSAKAASPGSEAPPEQAAAADPAALHSATASVGYEAEAQSQSGTPPAHGFERGSGEPSEQGMYRILGLLARLGNISGATGAAGGVPDEFRKELSELPVPAQDLLKQALAEFAARAPGIKPDQTVLVQLAEHLAIRFALERFERGDVKVNAVRQMLDRMNQEIDNLRKILGEREQKMSEAGLLVESQRELLDRQFWAAVPENAKRSVLLSEDAWCIPPRNVRSYLNSLLKSGNLNEVVGILQNYAGLTESEDAEARKRTAIGLAELAELYAQIQPKLLGEALRQLGVRLTLEQDPDVQPLVSTAFVQLTQQAAATRNYSAMQRALELANGVELQRPGIARTLRDKMGIEEHVPEFLEEALRAHQPTAGLTNVLRLVPQTSMALLAARFNRCNLREDAERVANFAHDLGEEGLQYLRSTVRGGPVSEAVEVVGLLGKLDLQPVMVFLPARMKDFPRASQDRVVRQLASSAVPGRCRMLLELLDHVDPLIMPIVIDEIGVEGEREALGRLMNILEGDLPAGASPYLCVKAAEALGRINAPESIAALKRVLETRKVFGWAHPQELRIAAWQALEKLDPAWARDFLPKSGLAKEDLALAPLRIAPHSRFVRQRRHTRVRLHKPVIAVSVNLNQNCRLEIKTVSLVGGIATIDRHLAPGTHVQLKLQVGLRHLQATALMRDYRAQGMSFEIVDMNLDERSKLRRLLADNLPIGAERTQTRPVPASDVAASN